MQSIFNRDGGDGGPGRGALAPPPPIFPKKLRLTKRKVSSPPSPLPRQLKSLVSHLNWENALPSLFNMVTA